MAGQFVDGGRFDQPLPDAIASGCLGSVTLEPQGDFVAGSYATLTLTYLAGPHGIDDSGALRLCFRFATDQGRLQFDDPAAPNYTTVTASNKAKLEYRFDYKANVRPWDRTLYIKVVDGFLKEGETITVRMGVTDGDSPGLRLQTFCEDTFEFRVLVDPIATFNFQPVPEQPTIRIVSGEPFRYIATIPTLWPQGEAFSLSLKGEDIWGNPSDKCDLDCTLECSADLGKAPKTIALKPGQRASVLDGLCIDRPGDYAIKLVEPDGKVVCETNPIRISADATRQIWGDLHGQSEETIGTNSAKQYFEFARDLAFLDVVGHQGNDFQITRSFWEELNELTAQFDEPGKFVTLPGYEWSGNTCLGGDRNIYFPEEGRTIRRSSHALVPDKTDIATDCQHAQELFDTLVDADERDVVIFAHCGGRYADIRLAHDGRLEKSVEIHSSWGTFDWILHDAFDMGYRVGIVANSDGHKGRPGASYPGASLFGAIGGLTCFHVGEITRDAVFDCLRRRHHYATSGGPNGRCFLQVGAKLPAGATVYHDDPGLGPAEGRQEIEATMGDIVHSPSDFVEIDVEVRAGCPIERVELFNGKELLEVIRPYSTGEDDPRIRLEWSGARYRGRFRQVIWDGGAEVNGNEIVSATPINFFNPEKRLRQVSRQAVAWQSLTTGNNAGCDLVLAEPHNGTLHVKAGPISFELPVDDIAEDDRWFSAPGHLPRTLRVVRLPKILEGRSYRFTRRVLLKAEGDNPIYVRLELEDGTLAWSSPLYLFR